MLLISNQRRTARECSGIAAEQADEPVTRAGLGGYLDRPGEQALAAGDKQRAQPEQPGRERGGMGCTGDLGRPPLRAADTSQPCTAISMAPVQTTTAGTGRPPTATNRPGPPKP